MRFPIMNIVAVSISILIPSVHAGNEFNHFSAEIQVKAPDTTGWESNQDMCVDSKGNLYVAWESASLMGSNHGIAIYRSTNGGLTWDSIGFLYNPDADLQQPSIAVGEGLMNRVIVAYLVDEGYGKIYPEAAYASLGSTSFITTPLPHSACTYSAPELWTDASQMNVWRAYVVCSELNLFDNEHNIVAWRSDAYASAWQPRQTVIPGPANTSWSRPHAAFGTTSKVSFIICCRKEMKRIEMAYTDDFGVTYNEGHDVAQLVELPHKSVNPQIAASRNNSNLTVCYCVRIGGYDELMYTHSTNLGSSWSSGVRMQGYGAYSRFGPELTADEFGGQGIHLTYTRKSNIYYHYIRQDFAGSWKGPFPVCDDGFASHADVKKGVACHPETEAAFISWCDTRDGTYDTDTFFNFSGSLVTSENKISASSAGLSLLYLHGGEENAWRKYLILGGVTGTKPGTLLPGGKATLPINWDLFTDLALSLLNTSPMEFFYGLLNNQGVGIASLKTPPMNPAYVGVVMYFAYCLNNPFDFASNAVAIEIVN